MDEKQIAAERGAFEAWCYGPDGLLCPEACTFPLDWDDKEAPSYHTLHDGKLHYLDSEWFTWKYLRAAAHAELERVRALLREAKPLVELAWAGVEYSQDGNADACRLANRIDAELAAGGEGER